MIRRHWKMILLVVVVLLIAARIALPSVMLNQANKFLAGYSKVFDAHIGDLDLSFIRMAYSFQKIQVKLRKDDSEVLFVGDVDVSLAWRELLKGVILTDIEISDARVKASPALLPAFKEVQAENEAKLKSKTPDEKKIDKEEVETIKTKLFPLRIERLIVEDSMFELSPGKNSPEEKRLVLDQMQVRISNVTPLEKKTKTVATFESRLMRNAKIKGVAQSRISKESFDWDVDAEMRDFNLTQANPFLLELVPFTFTSGTLDLFAEAKSENGAIVGYVKPFLKKADILARKEKFKNSKQFLSEIVAAVGNVIIQRPKLKSVATKVDFNKAGPGADFKVDILGALANAIEHRVDQAIAPSVEDEIILK